MNKKLWLPALVIISLLSAGMLWLTLTSSSKLNSSLQSNIAQLNIQTETDNQLLILKKVNSKEKFIKAKLAINTSEWLAYLNVTNAKLRGRGSSSFNQPKMPYRLKLNKKQSLLNLPATNDWVLLANYQDGSLLSAALSSKLAQLLNLPFSPHVKPVELKINNEYLGLYWLTAQRQISKQHINISNKGWLVELTDDEKVSSDLKDKNFYILTHQTTQFLDSTTKCNSLS